MGLETGTYISDLVSTNPVSGDPKSQGDDHIRLLKSTIKATFPNVNAAVTPTDEELNFVDGVTSNIQTQLDLKAPLASPVFTGTPESTTPAEGDNSTKIATTAFVVNAALTSSLPGQTGNAGKVIMTDGSTADWESTLDTSILVPLVGTDFATTTGTQTLSNKTITDPIIVDDADPTKEAAINLTAITAGQSKVITMPDNDVVWDTPGWRLLSKITAVTAATVDIETTIDGTYDEYVIVASDIEPSFGSKLRLRYKIGGSYITASNYAYSRSSSTNVGVFSNHASQTYIELMNTLDASAAGSTCLQIFAHRPSGTTKYKCVTWRGMQATAVVASSQLNVSGSGYLNSNTGAVTGIRIYMESGTIDGIFKLYGVRKSI